MKDEPPFVSMKINPIRCAHFKTPWGDEDENIAKLPARFRARALAQNGLHAAATQAADNH
jgi:hypothetical protein